jgi:hypothetical protein
MILDLLEKSKETKGFIGLNFYGSDNGFYCGYVLEYNDEFIMLQHFSKFGFNDGILVHKIADVKYLESDTDYINGIKALTMNQNSILRQTYTLVEAEAKVEHFNNLFESFIGNKEYLIKFEVLDNDIYFGFIEWCDENSFSMINIDSDGSVLGKAIFKFEDLKVYWVDDLESRKRIFFYKKRNGIG